MNSKMKTIKSGLKKKPSRLIKKKRKTVKENQNIPDRINIIRLIKEKGGKQKP